MTPGPQLRPKDTVGVGDTGLRHAQPVKRPTISTPNLVPIE